MEQKNNINFTAGACRMLVILAVYVKRYAFFGGGNHEGS